MTAFAGRSGKAEEIMKGAMKDCRFGLPISTNNTNFYGDMKI